MNIAGLGRLSIDVHLKIGLSYRRFDSQKLAAREVQALGGSVPWILAQTAAAGCVAHFIGPGARFDSGSLDIRGRLETLGIRGHLFEISAPSSYIEHEPGGQLRRIISIEEGPKCHLDPRACSQVLESISFDWLVLDGRHLAAAKEAGQIARDRGAGVLLDPGSTSGVDNLVREPELLNKATLICADSTLLGRLTGLNNPESAAFSLLDQGLEHVIITDERGRASWLSKEFDFAAEPTGAGTTGNSLGIGDAFRGWMLASLAHQGYRRGSLQKTKAEICLRQALAAAHARKNQACPLPEPVSQTQVTALLSMTRLCPRDSGQGS